MHIMAPNYLVLGMVLPLLTLSEASPLVARQDVNNTATVDLSQRRGSPTHWASGFIYGEPDSGFNQSPWQIPGHFYTDMGFQYARAGGAQMTEGGWVDGIAAYEARFRSTKDNYFTTRAYGGKFQILPHDVWGTDHANATTHWPGDDGDWTDYDKFLARLLSDLEANDMLIDLDWDLWNEPDGGYFWIRSEAQYLEMWRRTYLKIRSNPAFDGVLIVGPSSATQPSLSNGWWVEWLQYVIANNVVPDQYTWHDEPGDLAIDHVNFVALCEAEKAPPRQVNINEYGTYEQQVATGAAFWISRLERYDYYGLRGNWLSLCQLHDFMASLLGKADIDVCNGTGYYPNGEWQVYKYYNINMTGTRATTTGSGDYILDVYTTIGTDKVRTLTGVDLEVGTWYITIDHLSSVGLPKSGSLDIQTWGFIDNGHFGEVLAPTNRGIVSHTYTDDSVTFPVFQTAVDEYTAWAFEFDVGR